MRWRILAAGVAVITASAVPSIVQVTGASAVDPGVTVAAAGDIACPTAARTSQKCHQAATADLISQGNYAAVLPLGDTQYNCGKATEYARGYNPTWGRFNSIAHPVVGDNEYIGKGCSTSGASGYFNYFGSAAKQLDSTCNLACKGYYSYDLGSWHVVALNSNCSQPGSGGCSGSSAQNRWLRSDLAAHPTKCTLAYMHFPRWGNGTTNSKILPLVSTLYNAGAEVMLAGHAHLYTRYRPQTPSGRAELIKGIRQFIVGTGGYSHAGIKGTLPNTEYRNNSDFGILSLTLRADAYDWKFITEQRGSVIDSGTTSCH